MFVFNSGRMLPLRPPAGKPAPLVCTYAATGHNSAVLSLDVTEDLMFTGSKGLCKMLNYCMPSTGLLMALNYSCLPEASPPVLFYRFFLASNHTS